MFKIVEKNNINQLDLYKNIIDYSVGLMLNETDCIANLANISALLNQMLSDINWIGFYLVKDDQLVLGPFQGKVACIRIDSGNGVCGAAYASASTQLVADVHKFPGHIACDSDTLSEIVVPLIKNNKIVAVLDIDSPILNRFNTLDKEMLEKLSSIISDSCDWSSY